ncbi:apoptotic chromatin condensation inducer in the nucleus-like [Chelonus insularis]|uniref:apoptotic chromatin condensation inducer in the nucleus-like n=1 Tax=Chelonus insularis TaxID=460826 RepID=UPI00158A611D|nr:apoptotic chromatin condensation inducer in the nucleus-like [Chelonus insularis]XP_034936870.1 apoptotic chromatin condensation inducer in the nucleus-like [Chelonus insularis]
MRRKSERNKAKASPEKKVEKPTRKSTRRRAKKSPSTSPERENSNDADTVQGNEKESLLYKIQTRLHSKESENVVDEPETKVSSTETITKQQEVDDDSGSVWKAARADASPGEIPKLKLCRQRNLSETSDVSLSRKRTNKWQEGGEGIAEEADSADEKPATSLSTDVGDEPADNPSSTIPGRDSGEEVSDSKEFPPENASADLSDDKPNIDQQDDTNETSNCTTSIVDNQPNTPEPLESTETKTIVDADDAKGQQTENESNDRPTEENVKSPVENIQEEQKEPEVTKKDATSSEDEQDNNKSVPQSGSSENSNDESNEKKKEKETVRVPVRTTRRKHRDKYQDSSNSDSADSDDEPTITKEKPMDIETPTEQKSPIEQEIPETADRSSETELVLSHQTDITETDNDEAQNKSQKSILTEKIDQTAADQIQPSKPTKISLKRSFTSRISADTVEKRTNANENDTNQEKENHVSSDQVDPTTIPKKRRWGTVTSTDTTPAYSISTDSLKVLVPGAKPLSISEVRLSKDDEDDRERRKDRDKRYSAASIPEDKGKDDNDSMKTETTRRKISIVKDTPTKSPSPVPAQPTNILLIKNLVRPFTLNQIKELLSRTGVIVENGFWMDRIKSKCYVEYSNEDQAFETRQALHGISWPLSNPKKLQVEYATKEDMEQARELSKDQISSRKTEAMASADNMWQQEWIRDEKVNSNTKVTIVREWDLGKEDGQHLLRDKEREKKDIDKKRRQRSRSPALDTHLPAPARKFKKKEDEPPPAKLLDDLFRKTKATPCIYWLPLTNEQIVVKEEMRRQHMAEHARQLEEMRRAERNRDNRRRRSPRK